MIGRPSEQNRELHAAINSLYRQHEERVKTATAMGMRPGFDDFSRQMQHSLEPGTFQGRKMRLHPEVKTVSLDSHGSRGVKDICVNFHPANGKEAEELARRVFKTLRRLGEKEYRFALGKVGIMVTGKNNSDQIIGEFKNGELTLTISNRALEEKIRPLLFPLPKNTPQESESLQGTKQTGANLNDKDFVLRAKQLETITDLKPSEDDLKKLSLLVKQAKKVIPKVRRGEVFKQLVLEAGVLHRHLKPLLTKKEFQQLQPKKK